MLEDENWEVRTAAASAIENIHKKERLSLIDISHLLEPRKIKTHYLLPAQTTWHILHISDIHYSTQNSLDAEEIFEKFLESLKSWRKTNKNQKIDMVFLTGDVAWSGDEAQFEFMEDKIRRIIETADCERENFFIIPGNHDLEKFLAEPHPCKEELEKIYTGKVDINHQILDQYKNYRKFLKMLENYNNFLARMGINHSSWQKINNEAKPWYVVKLKDCPLAVIGLNSPLFISKKHHEDGKVKMGTRQFKEALSLLEKKKVQFIVLTHHPLDWLERKEREELRGLMLDHYAIHLLGHSHKHDDVELSKADGRRMLSFNVGSIYGKKGKDDFNSFEILSLNFQKCEVKSQLFVWDRDDKIWLLGQKRCNPYRLPSALRSN